MMSIRSFTRGLAASVPVLVLATGIALAAGPRDVWTARLSGDNEVPANDSKAGGSATFRVVYGDSDSTGGDSLNIARIEYRVRAHGLNDLTGGHIHIGAAGVAGPVAIDLHPTTGSGPARGVVAEGSFTAADLTGPLTGMTLSDLYALFASGEAYVNLHTTAYPSGEIRGQIDSRGGGGAQ